MGTKIIETSLPPSDINYNYSSKVWLIGDGRSGTTWVSDLINYDKFYREVFEPFHPFLISPNKFLSSHYYARPGTKNQELYDVSKRVFSGNFSHPRTDFNNSNKIYNALFIKDIFANLFSYWVHENFDDLKIILLVRNPFAVALSKYHKRHWHWVNDPMTLFNQLDLRNDYLYAYEDIIFDTVKMNSFILNQILIWAIIHFIPFRQFNSEEIHLLFYENILTNPIEELSRLTNYIDKKFDQLPNDII